MTEPSPPPPSTTTTSSPTTPTPAPPSVWFLIQVTFLASLGGVLFGYDMGAIGGTLPQIANTFDLNNAQQEWLVSILYLGGGVGAAMGGTLCDWMGRQKTILGTDVVFMLGALWLYLAPTYGHVLWGRFVVGIAVAVSGVADVSYLHEMAPPQWRGAMVSVNEACISLGFLLAYIAGYWYGNGHADDKNEEWRMVFGWAGFLALIQGLGMSQMPESPVWLAQVGSRKRPTNSSLEDESNKVEGKVSRESTEGGTYHSFPSSEVVSYQHSDGLMLRQDPSQSLLHTIKIQLQSILVSTRWVFSRYRRQVYIATFLAVTQQFCGQTNVLNYAPYIFAEAAGTEDPPLWSSIVIGAVKFVVTVIVIWKIEFVGRRRLLLTGISCISLGMLGLIVAFGGWALDDADTHTTMPELALPGVLLVVCGYSMSFGPLTWLLTSELFPTQIRGRALGASTILTYLCASMVTRTFLSASSAWGPSKVFGIYCFVSTAGILFAYLAIPDTGGKYSTEVAQAVRSMWWWRYDAIADWEEEASTTRMSPSHAMGRPDFPPSVANAAEVI
eukprot:Nitzschia sp. Nitz4//scaffold321_size20361//13798//15465//NITZ4_008687-RA/size20361-processed-gene-0.37-mRNA-1//-1//CDS//3329547787//6428//frame0